MSHVDEGLLHAYLDGAFPPGNPQGGEIESHLAVCVDCRVRLEDARRLKERAQVVLHQATPAEMRVPPFAALRARRPTGAPARWDRRTDWLPPIPLAFAATMVLAVGAGWMANELFRSEARAPAPQFADEAASAETDMAADRGDAASPARSAVAGARETERVAEASEDRAASRRPSAGSEPRETESRALRTPATQPQAAQPRLTEGPPPGLERVVVTGQAKAADTLGRRVAGDASAARMESTRLAAPGAARNAAAPAPLVRDANEVVRAEALQTEVPSAELEAAVDLLNDYYAAIAAGSWSEVPPVTATARLGRELAALVGEPVEAIELARVDDREVLRTRYRLTGDVVLELIQRTVDDARPAALATPLQPSIRAPADAAPTTDIVPLSGLDRLSPLFRGESVVSARRPGLVLLLRAALPADSLEAIARRIR